jgi:hypothetical protein
MKPMGRITADQQSDTIESVPTWDLDRAQQEMLRNENERLKLETERLPRERCPHVAAAWSRKAAKPTVRKRSLGAPSYAVLISRWAAAAI